MSTLKLLEEMSLKEIIVRKQNREFNIFVLKGLLNPCSHTKNISTQKGPSRLMR